VRLWETGRKGKRLRRGKEEERGRGRNKEGKGKAGKPSQFSKRSDASGMQLYSTTYR